MPEPLKYLYNEAFINKLGMAITEVVPSFNQSRFISQIFSAAWEQLELKQRMRHISTVFRNFLSENYEQSLPQIIKIIESLKEMGITEYSFEYMFFPDYIEVYGLDSYEPSIDAIEEVTQFTSCEFAVRPFILQYPVKMLEQMEEWSRHQHHMVRRLATEGSRPRLPWAMALPFLKKDPSSILDILERLKSDPSETVRRSVANNLNDISKDNPEVAISIAKRWIGDSNEVDWVVKHACRGLLKKGNSEVMSLFGFDSTELVKIDNFKTVTPIVHLGEYLEFEFDLVNTAKESKKIRLEYAIYFMKANGNLAKKVFSISEKEYLEQSKTKITRRQPFKIISTRKLYKGHHQVSLILNGAERDKFNFELIL